MKKFKILSAVAVAGLLGLSVRAAAPVNYNIVNVKLTVLIQTNLESSDKIIKIKLTTKDLLGAIADEFPSNAAAITASGAKLAVDDFFDGEFAVLNKTNGIVLADASTSTNADDYELNFDYDKYVYDYSSSGSKETYNYVTVADFNYENATGTSFVNLKGSAAVNYKYATKDTESFSFFGAGDGEFNSNTAVVTGTAKGAGTFDD